jgi:hypothetical protein
MRRLNILLFISLFIINISCEDNSTNSKSVKPNLNIDSTYSTPTGGDPRGNYLPNTPFVFYFGIEYDSLVQNTGEGWLNVQGATPDSGNFSYELLTKVGGTIGNNIYAIVPWSENAIGAWKVDNNKIIVTINGVTDTIMFSAKNNALFLIYDRFQTKPFDLFELIPGPIGSTVWVFK